MERNAREDRRTGLLPVRLQARDAAGRKISQLACTLNISRKGVRLVGIRRRLEVGSIVVLQYRQESGRFQVIWTRQSTYKRQWEAGLQCREPMSCLWMIELVSAIEPENFRQILKQALGDFVKTPAASESK